LKQFFVHFFAENHFPRNFPRNFLGNDLSKLFPRKNTIFTVKKI
jgi:hypothetical protein